MTETEDKLKEEQSGVLSRWSRNKAASRSLDAHKNPVPDAAPEIVVGNEDIAATTVDQTTTDVGQPAMPGGPSEVVEGQPVDAPEDELVLTDEDMPAIETLNVDSDYSGFLNKGVSPELRRKALQHLFRMPKFNIRDGLNDYDEDYTYFEPLGDTVTSDMRWHAARKEREEREAREAEEARLAENEEQQTLESSDDEQEAADSVADENSTDKVDDTTTAQEAESDSTDATTESSADVESASTADSTLPDSPQVANASNAANARSNTKDRPPAAHSAEIDDGSVV